MASCLKAAKDILDKSREYLSELLIRLWFSEMPTRDLPLSIRRPHSVDDNGFDIQEWISVEWMRHKGSCREPEGDFEGLEAWFIFRFSPAKFDQIILAKFQKRSQPNANTYSFRCSIFDDKKMAYTLKTVENCFHLRECSITYGSLALYSEYCFCFCLAACSLAVQPKQINKGCLLELILNWNHLVYRLGEFVGRAKIIEDKGFLSYSILHRKRISKKDKQNKFKRFFYFKKIFIDWFSRTHEYKDNPYHKDARAAFFNDTKNEWINIKKPAYNTYHEWVWEITGIARPLKRTKKKEGE